MVGLLLGGALGFGSFLLLLAETAQVLLLLISVLQFAPRHFREGLEVIHAFLKVLWRDLRLPTGRRMRSASSGSLSIPVPCACATCILKVWHASC